ncbi:MAG: site-specific DNA-methyltransferase [Bacteroidales bacterium]
MEVINIDCLEYSKKCDSNFFDLIYLDPPFFTQDIMRSSNKEYEFNDKWNNIDDYLAYMEKRFFEFKRILKDTGSIFVHCDRNASHYLKILLDKIFGMQQFQSEIIWSYKRWSNSKKGLLNSHQVILFYSKTKNFKFNTIFSDYSPTTNLDQILQSRVRDNDGKAVYEKDENGEVVLAVDKKGVPLSDVWEIPFLNPKAKERVNYPTQKPIALLERIISIVTDEGDKIYDPFCGSGTTLVASKLLGRDYFGTDISLEAVNLANYRLNNPIKTDSNLLKVGYDEYKNKSADVISALKAFDAKIVQRNKGVDGICVSNKYKFIPIKVCLESDSYDENLSLLVSATKKKNLKYGILLVGTNKKDSVGEYIIDGIKVVVSINPISLIQD